MNDMSDNEHQQSSNAILHEDFPTFYNGLEILYIKNNASGRLKFLQAWPAAAAYIFEINLMESDQYGGMDKESRAILEDQAEERRIALHHALEDIENKSVENGVLRLEYVEALIHDLGRDIAQYVYTSNIVNRVFPPSDTGASTTPAADKPSPIASPSPQPSKKESANPMTFIPAKKPNTGNETS